MQIIIQQDFDDFYFFLTVHPYRKQGGGHRIISVNNKIFPKKVVVRAPFSAMSELGAKKKDFTTMPEHFMAALEIFVRGVSEAADEAKIVIDGVMFKIDKVKTELPENFPREEVI